MRDVRLGGNLTRILVAIQMMARDCLRPRPLLMEV